MRLSHLSTLPIAVGLAVSASALGVYLGNSAVAGINPAYFGDPEPRFHADLAPNRSPDWAQVQVSEYQQAGLIEGLGDGCVGCRTWPEEYVPAVAEDFEAVEDDWQSHTRYPPEARSAAMVVAEDPEVERIERYAAYPVSAEEWQSDQPAEDDGEYYADGGQPGED